VAARYLTLAEMRAHGKAGCYWLTTANAGTPLIDERGQCWDLVSFLRAQTGEEVDVQVLLGKYERLPVRLIARRVSAEQAERRRKSANREKEVKAKGVQQPNVRKRRIAGDKRKRRKRKRRGRLCCWADDLDHQCRAHVAHGGRGAAAGTLPRAS
jgi:hypothetical protein